MKSKLLKVCGVIMICSALIHVSEKVFNNHGKEFERLQEMRSQISHIEKTLGKSPVSDGIQEKLSKIKSEQEKLEVDVKAKQEWRWLTDICSPLIMTVSGGLMLFGRIERK